MPVLIVDDDVDTRDSLAEYLGMHGFRCLTAASGAEALELALRSAPHAIVLDLVMRDGLSGVDVLRILKDSPQTKAIPILALTGLTGMRDELRDLGCDDYILKPVEPTELVRRLRRLCAFTPPPL